MIPLAATTEAGRTMRDGHPPLWKHQEAAIAFCKPKAAAALFMEMRTGKSRVVVELIARRHHRRVLILAPKAVAQHVWRDQIAQYYPPPSYLPCLTLAGPQTAANKAKLGAKTLANADRTGCSLAVVMNYETAWQPAMAAWLQSVPWDFLVCDESHKLKLGTGRASRFVGRLAQRIPHRILLTGTPMPHNYTDVWAQYRVLDPTIFGNSFVAFRATYGRAGGYMMHEWKLNPRMADALAQRIYRIAYRVMADDVLDMPEALDIPVTVELGHAARLAYDTLRKEMILKLRDHTLTPANAMVLALRLQQITGGTLPTDEGEGLPIDTAKADALKELLDDLPKDEPVVVFCKFRADLDAVHRVAVSLGRGTAEVSGRGHGERPNSVQWVGKEAVSVGVGLQAWLSGDVPILAAQIQAGGVGLDFSRAAYCVYFSVGYSLGDYEQSRWRLRGSAQKRAVGYYHLIAQRTVDTRVYAALRAKADAARVVLEALQHEEEDA